MVPIFMLLVAGEVLLLIKFSTLAPDTNAAIIAGSVIVTMIVLIVVAHRIRKNPAGPERTFIVRASGLRGEFVSRFRGYNLFNAIMISFFGVVVTGVGVATLAGTEAAQDMKPHWLPAGLAVAWVAWMVYEISAYRGRVRRYRVTGPGAIEVWRRGRYVAVDVERYQRITARRGTTGSDTGFGYWKCIQLRKPLSDAKPLTFLCAGARSIAHGTPVEPHLIVNYFRNLCHRVQYNRKRVGGQGAWVATPPKPGEEGGKSPEEERDVQVRGAIRTPDGEEVAIDMAIPAAELNDDEILDTVEALVQGDHPGGRWVDPDAVEILRPSQRHSVPSQRAVASLDAGVFRAPVREIKKEKAAS